MSVELCRGYALLDLKAVDEEQRVIEGIASTPTADRRGDLMEPKGAEFALPLPFLWQHDQEKPIGEVFEATASASGIRIKARIAKIEDPGALKTRIDEAWHTIKAKLVRGLSIGWKPIEASLIEATGGLHVYKWLWAELSAVTVPQNVEATILRVKELDSAATGRHLPGAAGLPVVRATKDAPAMKTIPEQITAFEATRAAKAARMTELMTVSAEKGETLDDAQTQEYDGLALEVKSIDNHLVRLRDLEQTSLAAATAITTTTTVKSASELRGGTTPVVTVKANVPKGTAFTRYVMCKIAGKGSQSDALSFYREKKDWVEQTPEVELLLKAAVNWGTITEPAWAAPLAVQQPIAEFLELLRPATLIGKIPMLRRVPFNISIPIQTGGGTYNWVGEGAPKPVGNLQFTSATLGIAKAAGIIVISEELAKISSPSAEATVRADMVAGMAQYLDQQFITPSVAAVAGVSPGSITNGAPSGGSVGTSADNARTDIKGLIGTFVGNNQSVASAVLIMSEANAFNLSVALNPLGQPLYPSLTATGGTILGITTVTSQAAGNVIALIQPNEILFADDGGVNIDVSREASVEMNTTPASPVAAGTILVSLWQQNLIGLRAERFINWKRARLTAVYYITQTYV